VPVLTVLWLTLLMAAASGCVGLPSRRLDPPNHTHPHSPPASPHLHTTQHFTPASQRLSSFRGDDHDANPLVCGTADSRRIAASLAPTLSLSLSVHAHSFFSSPWPRYSVTRPRRVRLRCNDETTVRNGGARPVSLMGALSTHCDPSLKPCGWGGGAGWVRCRFSLWTGPTRGTRDQPTRWPAASCWPPPSICCTKPSRAPRPPPCPSTREQRTPPHPSLDHTGRPRVSTRWWIFL